MKRTIARGHAVLEKAGLPRQKIGVRAINPHAGENGLFGHGEEAEKISPALASCRAKRWDVEGPLPADTLFFARAAAISTWWSQCITTRGTGRSRCWASRRG